MKKDSLKVQVFQQELVWEDVDANLLAFERALMDSSSADLALLPEMFSTGFSMRPEQMADGTGKVLNWMIAQSQKHSRALCGSTMVEQGGLFYNRLYFVKPNGEYQQYDKRHLFTMGEEPAHFTAGKERILIDYLGWKILPLICYDLRFPVFSRNDIGYDILIYVANWPEKRAHHWNSLLQARAIENQSYVLACNRIGLDGHVNSHSGDSSIIDYKGEILAKGANETVVLEAVISHSELTEAREKFPVLADADSFSADWK